jgi:hypothetical protein
VSAQFIFVVAAGSLAEELFFRVAIQGGLAHALQYTAKGPDEAIIGVSALVRRELIFFYLLLKSVANWSKWTISFQSVLVS